MCPEPLSGKSTSPHSSCGIAGEIPLRYLRRSGIGASNGLVMLYALNLSVHRDSSCLGPWKRPSLPMVLVGAGRTCCVLTSNIFQTGLTWPRRGLNGASLCTHHLHRSQHLLAWNAPYAAEHLQSRTTWLVTSVPLRRGCLSISSVVHSNAISAADGLPALEAVLSTSAPAVRSAPKLARPRLVESRFSWTVANSNAQCANASFRHPVSSGTNAAVAVALLVNRGKPSNMSAVSATNVFGFHKISPGMWLASIDFLTLTLAPCHKGVAWPYGAAML